MRPRILLIEDSAMLRRIAASVLHAQPARYEVIAATRAAEGFAQACGGAHLLLADYRLAGAGGLDLCRRLLGEARTARLPVVLLVGRGLAAPEFDALPENVVETLGKPFAPMQLAALVNLIYGFSKSESTLRGLRMRLRQPEMTAEASQPVVRAQEPLRPRAPHNGASRAANIFPPVPPEGRVDVPANRSKPPETASLRAACRQMAAERATGILRLGGRERATTDVYLEEGRPLVVSTRDAQTYSEGAADLLPAKISPATLTLAADEQARTGAPFLLTLGARGLLSKTAAVALVRHFGQRHLARSWALHPKAVEFTFEPLESLPPFALRLDAERSPTDQWLLESLRLLRLEDVAADALHEGRVGTPIFQPGSAALLHGLALTGDEQAFAGQVNSRHDLPALARAVGLSTEEAYLLLYRFRCLEIMDYRSVPAPFKVTPRTVARRVLPLLR